MHTDCSTIISMPMWGAGKNWSLKPHMLKSSSSCFAATSGSMLWISLYAAANPSIEIHIKRTMCDQSEPTTWIKLAALPRTSLSQTSTWMHLRIPGKLLCGTAPAPSSALSTHELLQCYMMLHCLLWQLICNMLMQLPSKQSHILQQHRLSEVQKITSFPLYMTVRKTVSLKHSGSNVWHLCTGVVKHMLQAPLLHVSTKIDPHDIRSVCLLPRCVWNSDRNVLPSWNTGCFGLEPGHLPGTNGELISLEAMLSLSLSKLISNSDVRLQKNSAVGSLHSPGSWPSGFWRKIHAHPRLMRYACHDMSWRSCLHYTWPISRTCWRLAISFSKARSR